MPPQLVAVIPVYNHASRVATVARGLAARGLPVLVVDDGSSDDPAAALAGVAGVTLVRHAENRGKGAALLTGLALARRAGAAWALTLDADGQHDPADAARFLARLAAEPRAILLGVRQGMDPGQAPWSSRWGRRFSNFWVWAAGGGWQADSQSGFRAYPLPETLGLAARARRFQFEVEILVLAAWAGLPVREAPVTVVYQPGAQRVSHFRPWRDFWRNSRVFTRLVLWRIFLPARLRARLALRTEARS
ncbi:MAG: glycosyltransferase [Deltaproteobacteria bacterium]|nr:glycosyltransferase [Deltaproteobacteria bacterium]